MAPSVDVMLLDVNGVLYDYDPEARVTALARSLDVAPSAVHDALFGSGLEDASDAGELAPADYLAAAGDRLGVELDADRWAEALAAAVVPMDDVLGVVERVQGQVRCATLSNNGLLVRDMADRIYPAIAALGVEVHVAAEFGESKPDRDVYLDACIALGSEPGRTAFVDDKAANVDGATRAGLRAHHFTDRDGLVDFLRDLGLDPGAGTGRPGG